MWLGKFTAHGSPIRQIALSAGVRGPRRRVNAILDTGYEGFVFLPMAVAQSAGLQAQGTTTVIVADGSVCPCAIADGYVWLDGRTKQRGMLTIELGISREVLVGMEFLHAFGLAVIVGRRVVALHEERAVEAFIQRSRRRRP